MGMGRKKEIHARVRFIGESYIGESCVEKRVCTSVCPPVQHEHPRAYTVSVSLCNIYSRDLVT